MQGWRSYLWDRPPLGERVILAREPDRITHHEPRPMSAPVTVGTSPPWFNVAGLLWRAAGGE